MEVEEMLDSSKEEKERYLSEILKNSFCVSQPKIIANIRFLGNALVIPIYDFCNFVPPTNEQRKNLKEMLCIDVEILGE